VQSEERILGVEGGGTKTAWVLAQRKGEEMHVLEQGRLPPSNLRLTSPERLREIFQEFPRQVDRAGVFLAGCVTDEDKALLARLCNETWPGAKIVTGSDRESGMAAALGNGDGIVVNAGSGSSVTGRRDGRLEKAGGWGHILGDAGGAYVLVVQALRLIVREYDLHRGEVQFTARILQALSLNDLDQLVRWAQEADKMEVALLAPVVFEAAAAGDERVLEIIEEGARVLSAYTEAVASRLHLLAPKVMLMGGLFQRDSLYAHAFRRRLKKNLPDARVGTAERAPEMGAAWLAAEMHDLPPIRVEHPEEELDNLAASLTEQRNPRSEDLEKLSVQELVKLFVEEESSVQKALEAASGELARAIQMVADCLKKGGHLFYVGAGSSGRIGVLDASEIPPTFGASPDLVQGIVAGGVSALYRSVEGAEDERGAGAAGVTGRGIKSTDIVLGISASGRTPFVAGALGRAKEIGAKTILLNCNPKGATNMKPDLLLGLAVGPEILTGSTRLKGGTATKVALNIISTGAMVALGKVRGNLMIDLHTSNVKLRDRATRMVAELAGTDYAAARRLLEESDWNLRKAIDQHSPPKS
jgi:N-acetylmuramic acid 6-phosphate etherase